MISRKTLGIVALSVCALSASSLYYTKKDREASVKKYFNSPQVGDIYKMKRDTREDGVSVFYLKIKDIGQESIYFYRSRMTAGALNDTFLKQFDTTETVVLSKAELAEIAAAKPGETTQLVEIERK